MPEFAVDERRVVARHFELPVGEFRHFQNLAERLDGIVLEVDEPAAETDITLLFAISREYRSEFFAGVSFRGKLQIEKVARKPYAHVDTR